MDTQFVGAEFSYELVINSDNGAQQQQGRESEVCLGYLTLQTTEGNGHNKTYYGIALNGI